LRLTAWYAGIFAVSSALAFVVVYALMVSVVQEQTDEDLREDIAEFESFLRVGGLDRIRHEMMLETQGDQAEDVFFRLWASDGRLLAATDLSSWPGLASPPEAALGLAGDDAPTLETLALPEREHGTRAIYGAVGPGLVLQIGSSLEEQEEFTDSLLNGFLITLAVVIVLGGPIGWFMARRALRGIEEVRRTATEIANGALDRRVPVRSRGDELDKLAQTFNTMLDRIQSLIVGMREMTDNLAHDLRSPLARIRASAEVALGNGRSRMEYESLAINTTEECDRLLELINTTLDIAEAESGAAELKAIDVDLVDLVRNACDLFQTVAEDRGLAIAVEVPTECRIRGDRPRLQRVIGNLLDNALKYTPAGGRVHVHLVDEGEFVRLAIADTGIGIPADQLPRVFERFYRGDRSRSENGNGLGLSLALAFVRIHGGDITARSVPGQGSTFTAILPRTGAGRSMRSSAAVA
jgi:heavy metal sensor kinase